MRPGPTPAFLPRTASARGARLRATEPLVAADRSRTAVEAVKQERAPTLSSLLLAAVGQDEQQIAAQMDALCLSYGVSST